MRFRIPFATLVAALMLCGSIDRAGGGERDYELHREWFALWGKAWARKECAAIRQHLAEGIKHGDPLAHELSGIMIVTRTCSEEGLDVAVTHFLKAANHGRERSMLLLAKLHALGRGVPLDEAEGRRWAQRAILGWVDEEPADRRERLASAMENDVPSVVQKEFDRIEPLMDGSPETKTEVAAHIEQGDGFRADPQRACLWRLSAANDGMVRAQTALGRQLLEGRGVQTNPKRGVYWLHRAAVGGDPAAQAALGKILASGQFAVRKDPHAAYRWLSRAKAAGLPVDDTLAEAAALLKPEAVDFLSRSAFEVTPGAPKMVSHDQLRECD